MPRKLVRDGVKKIMEDQGLRPKFEIATDEDRLTLLLEKEIEEAKETLDKIRNGVNDPEFIEELADRREVHVEIEMEIRRLGIDQRIDDAMRKKRKKRGGFSKGYILCEDS